MAKLPANRDVKWDDSYFVQAYQLARGGASDNKVAQALGVSPLTFARWVKKRRALRMALKEARGATGTQKFSEYVYDRLPAELQTLWKEIKRCGDEPNGVSRMEAMLDHAGVRARQHLFVYALVNGNFNASEACRAVNISKRTFDAWVSHDPDFSELVDEIHWHKANFFEGALCALVERQVPSIVKFANQTLNKNRGYDKPGKGDSPAVNVHLHSVVPIDELNLDLETRRAILAKMQARKNQLPAHEDVPDAEFTVKGKEVDDGRQG